MVIILKQIYELKTFRSNFNLYLSLFIVSLPLLRPKKCVRILAVKIFQIVRKLSTWLFLSLFLLSVFFLSFFLSITLSLSLSLCIFLLHYHISSFFLIYTKHTLSSSLSQFLEVLHKLASLGGKHDRVAFNWKSLNLSQFRLAISVKNKSSFDLVLKNAQAQPHMLL